VSKIFLEVCVASPDDAVAADAGGADRLELNCALELGGLTPTLGLLDAVRAVTTLPIIAMVRPRPSGFCYSTREFATMLNDAQILLDNGVAGLAFGVLLPSGALDMPRCRMMRAVCGAHSAVFHRAFDVVPDPALALEQLIDMGFQRVMSSGQEASASAGIPLLAALHRQAAGRIELLPAGGINPSTVGAVVQGTGCTQVHASLRKTSHDSSVVGRPHVRFGSVSGTEAEYRGTDQAAVQALVRSLAMFADS
jgi:copper homeostasis protein